MTDDMNEKLLQEYLEGRSPVSDAYEAAEKPGPPAELDRAVLAEARAAARATGSPQWQTWLMPASLAATVTLCIALVTEVIVFDPLLKTADSPQVFSDALEETTAPAAAPATAGRQSLAREMPESMPQRSNVTLEAKLERFEALDEVTSAATLTAEERPEGMSAGRPRDNFAAPEPTSGRRISERQRTDQKDDVGQAVASSARLPQSALAEGAVASTGFIQAGSAEESEAILVTARSRADSPAWPAADVWLAGIRFLFEQGEQERAEAELDKFREHYPDYPLGELVRGTDED